MAALADIEFDRTRPALLAQSWTDAVDGDRLAPYDDDLARLRSMGIADIDDDPAVLLDPKNGGGPRVWFQSVPEPKRVKNRVHVDLRTDDLEREVARLLELGARQRDAQSLPDLVVGRSGGQRVRLLRP